MLTILSEIPSKVITYPEFCNVANMDHLWSVIKEAAQASQPDQILFVFQLKAKHDLN